MSIPCDRIWKHSVSLAVTYLKEWTSFKRISKQLKDAFGCYKSSKRLLIEVIHCSSTWKHSRILLRHNILIVKEAFEAAVYPKFMKFFIRPETFNENNRPSRQDYINTKEAFITELDLINPLCVHKPYILLTPVPHVPPVIM